MENNLNKINMILDKIIENEDLNHLPSRQEYENYINQKGYNIIKINKYYEDVLAIKKKNYATLDDFQEACLREWAAYIISLIKNEYGLYLKERHLTDLDNLILQNKIILKKPECMDKTRYGETVISGGQSHQNGVIDMAAITATNEEEFIKKARKQLGVLTHEIFHQTHQFRIGKNLEYFLNGEKKIAQNYAGYLLEEGLTDKCAMDLSRKYNLPFTPNVKYNIYTQLVEAIEETLKLNNGQLFDMNYQEIFKRLDSTGELLNKYEYAEVARYTSLFVKNKNNQVEFLHNGTLQEASEIPDAYELDKKNYMISQTDSNEKKKNLLESKREFLKEIKNKSRTTNEESIYPGRGYINIFLFLFLLFLIGFLLSILIFHGLKSKF